MIGLILVKELAMVDKAAHTPVSTLKMRSLPFLRASTPLYDLLHLFEVGRCHMAVLTGPLPAKDAECSPDMAANAPSAEGLQQPGSDHVHAQWLGQQQQQDQQHQLLHDGQGHGKCWQPESATSPAHLISTEHHGLVLDQVVHAVLCVELTTSAWSGCSNVPEHLVDVRHAEFFAQSGDLKNWACWLASIWVDSPTVCVVTDSLLAFVFRTKNKHVCRKKRNTVLPWQLTLHFRMIVNSALQNDEYALHSV